MLTNAPIEYKYNKLPDGWSKVTDHQIYSHSDSTTVIYRTPKYSGKINWCWNEIYGSLAQNFEINGERLYACNGECLFKHLNIPEDYCIRTGKDGWMKLLTREYFEMWLQIT